MAIVLAVTSRPALTRRGLFAAAAATVPAVALLPTPAQAATPSSAAVIGDSTVARAPNRYVAALRAVGVTRTYVNGVGGRKLAGLDSTKQTAATAIQSARSNLGTVDTWLVSLGINSMALADAEFIRQVQDLLNLMTPDRVLWYDTSQWNPTNAKSVHSTALLRSTVNAFPNALMIEWGQFVHDPAVDLPALWLAPNDVTHNSDAGFDLRAMFGAAQALRS